MEKISFGTSNLPGYEVGPKTAPGLLVIQEWWGVTPNIKEIAEKLSKECGLRCLIPDLYKGKIGVDAEEASHLMNGLDWKQALEELKEAVGYLKASGSAKVGCVGFCMGGALTFAAAQHAGLDCAAPFYGIPGAELCQPEAIKVPILAQFGQHDQYKGFSDPETAKALGEKMKAAGCPAEFVSYPNCGHGFMNALTEDGRESYKKSGNTVPDNGEVGQALDKLKAFLKQHLGA